MKEQSDAQPRHRQLVMAHHAVEIVEIKLAVAVVVAGAASGIRQPWYTAAPTSSAE